MFGKESTGLPEAFRAAHAERCIRIPIREGARCLNLSNAAAVLAFEALRQWGFPELEPAGEMAEGNRSRPVKAKCISLSTSCADKERSQP